MPLPLSGSAALPLMAPLFVGWPSRRAVPFPLFSLRGLPVRYGPTPHFRPLGRSVAEKNSTVAWRATTVATKHLAAGRAPASVTQ